MGFSINKELDSLTEKGIIKVGNIQVYSKKDFWQQEEILLCNTSYFSFYFFYLLFYTKCP